MAEVSGTNRDYPTETIQEPNPKRLKPDSFREIYNSYMAKRNHRLEKFKEIRAKMDWIHDQIHKNKSLFVEERKNWVDTNHHLRSDMNRFFQERCKWEILFEETHFKPLYQQRRVLAESFPLFWSRSISPHMILYNMTRLEDEGPFKYMLDVESNRTTNFKGFELNFTFRNNPYFENKVLTKKYEVTGDNDCASFKAIGTKIIWKSHHNLTEKRGKRCRSFFTFFKSYASVEPLFFDMEADELKGDFPDPDDYEIGIKFRDTIIPYTISPFGYPTKHTYVTDSDADSDELGR